VLPVTGALMLTGIFVKAFIDYSKPHAGLSKPILGIGAPVVIGIGSLLLGVVVMLIARAPYRDFFANRPEVADPAALTPGYVSPEPGAA
jgi:hypothetical protein